MLMIQLVTLVTGFVCVTYSLNVSVLNEFLSEIDPISENSYGLGE